MQKYNKIVNFAHKSAFRIHMKKILTATLALILLHFTLNAQDIKVISYNIRYEEAKDGTNSWVYRFAASGEMIQEHMPDIFGLQEATYNQVHFFEQNFECYKYIGGGREDGKKKGEYTALYWNKKTISQLDGGMFWLSETPETASMGWDAQCLRTATWGLFKHKKTGKKFYCVNTHLDHVGKEARQNGLKLIMERIAEMNKAGLPVVLMGDFNMKPGDYSLSDVEEAMNNARKTAEKTDSHATFNNWGKSSDILDYIFYTGFSACPEFQTITKKYADRKFISDHYPVMVLLGF